MADALHVSVLDYMVNALDDIISYNIVDEFRSNGFVTNPKIYV